VTVEPDSDEAKTEEVGTITERLEEYLEVLDDEQEVVRQVLEDLEDAPDGDALTREEYRQVFPATMPLEEWGGFGG
jgi:predicted transcriptional regulator